jgi:hypothetical protein
LHELPELPVDFTRAAKSGDKPAKLQLCFLPSLNFAFVSLKSLNNETTLLYQIVHEYWPESRFFSSGHYVQWSSLTAND